MEASHTPTPAACIAITPDYDRASWRAVEVAGISEPRSWINSRRRAQRIDDRRRRAFGTFMLAT